MKYADLTIKYYHGSKKRFKDGLVLLPQSDGYLHSNDEMIVQTETILEQYRPTGCLRRSDSVFMVSDPAEIDSAGGYIDYVYLVKPQGKIERNNLSWYSEIGNYLWDDINDPEVKQLAENYWNGVPYKNEENSLWEYRASSAQIIKLVEEN